MAEQKPGIVITGTENFEGKQGFIPAEEALEAGVVTTGVTKEPEVAEAPKATKKAAKKVSKKGK